MNIGQSLGPELPIAGRPRERRDAAENRGRILEAARRLIATGDRGALSMDALAAAAGVGKGTIFRRFGDRSGLIDALVDEYMRDFQDAFLAGPPPLGPGAPPGPRLEAFLIALVHLHIDNLEVALQSVGALSASAREGAIWPLHFHVQTLLRAMDPDVDGPVVATLLLGMVAPSSLQLMLRVQGFSVAQVIAALKAVLNGAVPRESTSDG